MHNRKLIFKTVALLLGLYCLPYFVQAQSTAKTTIKGTVTDTATNDPVPGALVQLLGQQDSIRRAAITNANGAYTFQNLPMQPYQLKVRFLGYKQDSIVVNPKGQLQVQAPAIALKQDTRVLKEVAVEGKMPMGEQRGDTTAFNARAFKTNPEANAEDLLRKMPGITVEGNTVNAQGEQVRQVLVDGKEFFSNDPSLALRSLPAEVISKIEVFDQLSEQSQFTGFDDGNTTKTINIVTKPESRNGEFGNAYVGGGYDDKYDVGLNMHSFQGDRRLSLIGLSNNINKQNFSSQDLVGVTSGGGGRRNFGGRGPGRSGGGGVSAQANDFLVGQQSGITQTHSLGFNYTDQIGKKLELNANYFFNASSNDAIEALNREYFLTADSSQFYTENNNSNSQNSNHRFNMRLNYTIDRRNSIVMRSSINTQQNSAQSNVLGLNTSQTDQFLSNTGSQLDADINGYNVSNLLLFRHRTKKLGRTVSVRLQTGLNGTNGLTSQTSFTTAQRRGNLVTDSLAQQTDVLNRGFSYNANISLTERIGRSNLLFLNYSIGNNINNARQETFAYDVQAQEFALLDTALSNTFENTYLTQNLGLGLRKRMGQWNLVGRVNLQHARLNNEETFPNPGTVNTSFTNLLPFVLLRKGGRGSNSNIRIIYRSNATAPSANQLQQAVNNSNPLQLSAGNPDLEQAVSHSLITRYNILKPETSRTFIAFMLLNYTNQYIGTSTFIAQQDTLINEVPLIQGGQFSQPVNLNNFWNARAFITYGHYWKGLKSNVNLNTGVTYNATPGIINGLQNTTHNTQLSQGLVLSSNISQRVDFTVSSTANVNWVRNVLQPNLNDNFFSHVNRVNLQWTFWKQIFVETQASNQYFLGLADEFNQSYTLWNISFGTRLFKNNRGMLKATVFDVLNQNNSINRTVNDVYVEDSQSNVLQRYFMLTFSYNLRSFQQGNRQGGQQPGGPDPMRGGPGGTGRRF